MVNVNSKKIIYGLIALLPCLGGNNALALGNTALVSPSVINNQNQYGDRTSISANGRMVAFSTGAFQNEGGGIVSGNIFLYDKVTKKTRKITNLDTGFSAGPGFAPSLSADGRFLAFASTVPCEQYIGGQNPYTQTVNDILLYDNQSKKTICATRGPGSDIFIAPGVTYQAKRSNPSVSSNGRYVVFSERPISITNSITNIKTYYDYSGVVVYDQVAKTTSVVSMGLNSSTPAGRDPNLSNTSISADGRYVAFDSQADNLVAGDTNTSSDVFVHDRQTKITSRVSISSSGRGANGISTEPSISADGRYIAFISTANNLVTADTNKKSDIFVHDLLTQQTTRVSVATSGVQQNNFVFSPRISADGRYVTFYSGASNLVAGDNNGSYDIFVHDRQTKRTTLASGVFGNANSYNNSLSADGNNIAFWTHASNLVANDTNGLVDLLIRDLRVNTAQLTNISIINTGKPVSIPRNDQGNFVFSITNNGTGIANNVRIQHLLSNATIVSITPSQGSCKSYASISLCTLGNLSAGGTITLTVSLKPTSILAVNQQLSISSDAFETLIADNYLNLSTPVK